MSFGTSTFGEGSFGGEAASGGVVVDNSEAVTLTDAIEVTGGTSDFLADEGVTLAAETNVEGPGGYLEEIAESITLGDLLEISQAGVIEVLLDAALVVGESTSLSDAYAAQEGFSLAAGLEHHLRGVSVVEESLSVNAKLAILFDALAEEAVSVEAGIAYMQAVGVVEALQLHSVVSTQLQAIQLVAEAIAVGDHAGGVSVELSSETVHVVESIANTLQAVISSAEAVLLSDETSQHLNTFAVVEDGFQISDSAEYHQRLIEMIEEGVNLSVSFRLGNDVYAAWLLNPSTGGVSRYEEFPFNSMAYAYGKYYAAAENGVYLMEGDDDDGVNISAMLKTGLEDLGERRMKRINEVFLGVLTSGQLVLKVTADEEGARTEWWYNVVDHGDASNHRVKVGRGLQAVYYGFELVNVDGADFDLDNLQLYPLTLSRRV